MTSFEPEWLTTAEVSERLSLPLEKVTELIQSGDLHVSDDLVSLESVQTVLAEGKQIPPVTDSPT